MILRILIKQCIEVSKFDNFSHGYEMLIRKFVDSPMLIRKVVDVEKWMSMKWLETDFKDIWVPEFIFFSPGRFFVQFQSCQRHTSLHTKHMNYARMVVDWCVPFDLLHQVTNPSNIAFSKWTRLSHLQVGGHMSFCWAHIIRLMHSI